MTIPARELKVLVVDDSAVNRRSISDMLSELRGVRVVGKAANGEEALRLLHVTEPDAITLDLEMPRMDGFTFLRILMAKKPLPVLVVSSYSQKENVFKALELGAVDFIAKPDLLVPGDASIRAELTQKIAVLRSLWKLKGPLSSEVRSAPPEVSGRIALGVPRALVVIAASTGGPTALMDIVSALPADLRASILIAQHMPEKFTRTFAERMERRSQLSVREAEDGEPLGVGEVLVSPGMRCMEVVGPVDDSRVRVLPPLPTDRFAPSADRLFQSAASVWKRRVIGVVLTGMADDGTRGSKFIKQAGGRVLAESAETAVVYGMPRAVAEAGLVDRVLPLHHVAQAIVEEVRTVIETRDQ